MGIKETAGKTDTEDTSMYGGKQSLRRRGTKEKKKKEKKWGMQVTDGKIVGTGMH